MNIDKTCLNVILVAYFFIVPLGSILGHYGIPSAFQTFKIVFLCFLIMGLPPFLREMGKAKSSPLSMFLMFGFLYSLFRGISVNEFSTFFLSHVYSGLMPILVVSYGRWIYCKFDGDVAKIFSVFDYVALPLLLLILIYFFAYKAGLIGYFGVSTQASFLVVYFLLKDKNSKLNMILSIASVFLSGKRGGLLTLAGGAGYMIFRGMHYNPKKFIPLLFPILVAASMAIWGISSSTDLLKRFTPVFSVDVNDAQSLFLATGGRSLELSCIIQHIQEEDLLLLGGGAGESFLLYHNLREDSDYSIKGFSHFSPMSLTLVYGLVYAIAMYLMLMYLAFKRRKDENPILSVFLVMGLISSIGGSVLMYDPFFWFVAGLASKKKRN